MLLNIFIHAGVIWLIFYCLYSAYKSDGSARSISHNLAMTFSLFMISLMMDNQNEGYFILVIASVVIFAHNITIFFGKRRKK